MIGNNGKCIRTAELIFQPCGSSTLPSMCQHVVVDMGFAFKAAVPANQGIADFIGRDRLRHSSRFRNRLLNRFGRRFFLRRFFRVRELRFIVHPRIDILLLLGEVPVFPDEGGDALGHLRPVQLHRGTSAFGQPDALGTVIFGGMVSPGQRMRAPADAVFLLQKIRFFLHGVVCCKISVDSALAARHGTAACKCFADFILGNKALRFRKLGRPVRIYPALGGDVPDSLPQLIHPVIMKAQKFSVFRVVIQKCQEFAAKRIGKSAVLHLLRKRCGGVRITGRKIIHGGEVACLVCFITQVMLQIKQALRQFGTDTPISFGELHIGSKPAFFQQLSDSFCCSLPCNDLRISGISGLTAFVQMNAVSVIPRGIVAVFTPDAVAAMKFSFQQRRDFLNRLLLLERIRDMLSGVACITAETEHIVDFRLGKRKSGQHFGCAIRFINLGYLLLFREEKVHGELFKLCPGRISVIQFFRRLRLIGC